LKANGRASSNSTPLPPAPPAQPSEVAAVLVARPAPSAVGAFGGELRWPAFVLIAAAASTLAHLADHQLVYAVAELGPTMEWLAGVASLPADGLVLTAALGVVTMWTWYAVRTPDAAERTRAALVFRRTLFVAVAVMLAEALEELASLILSRQRPSVFLATGEDAIHRFGFRIGGKWGSFPSGHVARAFAAASALWMVSGRWRGGLFLLALAVAVARVVSLSHFGSDVVAGAFLGLAAASLTAAGWTFIVSLRHGDRDVR